TTETPEHNSRRFIGKEKDKETGLVYIGARYLDPETGRFLQPDPVGPVDPMTGKVNVEMLNNPQRLNRYAYGLNNPYRYIDPDGKDIVLSVDPKAAGGNGHTSLYFQNKEGQWHSYDQGVRGATSSGNGGAVFLMGL
ncbi:MAG: RHS repeat-associated core domain-containing protein, partial [Pseudomonadota bacterium]